jgi:hypothetical protein
MNITHRLIAMPLMTALLAGAAPAWAADQPAPQAAARTSAVRVAQMDAGFALQGENVRRIVREHARLQIGHQAHSVLLLSDVPAPTREIPVSRAAAKLGAYDHSDRQQPTPAYDALNTYAGADLAAWVGCQAALASDKASRYDRQAYCSGNLVGFPPEYGTSGPHGR